MNSNKYQESDWLEHLQRESWHLELLVSGFSIFLLVQAYEGLSGIFAYLNLHVALSEQINGLVRSFVGIVMMGSVVLICNLILHVFIRGFWVGTVGLRSVQDKINIESLGYSEFFTKELNKRVSTLDKLLEKLDTLASVIFAFTFLVVFMFLSLFLYFFVASLLNYGGSNLFDNLDDGIIRKVLFIINGILFFGWLVIGLIYMIDTLSLGWMKKYQKVSKLYFWIYKIMGVVTLAFLYRSIYYSLISRFSKFRIRLALLFYILIFALFPFIKYDQYIYYPDNGNNVKLDDVPYDDTRAEGISIWNASIPSKFMKESYMPLFVRYRPYHNETIKESCSDWTPTKADGFNSGIKLTSNGFTMNEAYISEDNPEGALNCLEQYFTVQLDSSKIKTDFYLYRHPNNEERGVMTIIDIDSLTRGKHLLNIKRKAFNKQKVLVDTSYIEIPFWVE